MSISIIEPQKSGNHVPKFQAKFGVPEEESHPHAGPEVGSLNKKRPDIRPLYLLFVELENDLVTIEIYVVSDLESPPNS